MFRTLTGQLTPSRARLLKYISEQRSMPVSPELEAESKKDLVDCKHQKVAQFIYDMNFRCAVHDRTVSFETLQKGLNTILYDLGVSEYAYIGQHKLHLRNLSEIDIGHKFSEIKEKSDTLLIVDIDHAETHEQIIYRLFNKVIFIGAKINQFSFFDADIVDTTAKLLYPSIYHSMQEQRFSRSTYRSVLSGVCPHNLNKYDDD